VPSMTLWQSKQESLAVCAPLARIAINANVSLHRCMD